jgi:hypothetical protein
MYVPCLHEAACAELMGLLRVQNYEYYSRSFLENAELKNKLYNLIFSFEHSVFSSAV